MTTHQLISWVEKNYPKYKCEMDSHGSNINMFCGVTQNALLYLASREVVIPTSWADDETKRIAIEINHWIKNQP